MSRRRTRFLSFAAGAVSVAAVVGVMAAGNTGGSASHTSAASRGTVSSNVTGLPHNPPQGSGNDFSTTASTCGALVHNGDNNSTRNFYAAIPAGTDWSFGGNLDVYVLPGCGTSGRNFVIDSGEGLRNPLGDLVDDRHLPTPLGEPVFTAPGGGLPATPVYFELSVDWNLCQSFVCIRQFWSSMCQKYSCAGPPIDLQGNRYPTNANATSSAPGWNRMLAEEFGRAIDKMIRNLVPYYPATIINDDAAGLRQQNLLAAQLSREFNSYLNSKTGSPYKLICGPGNSYTTSTGNGYHCALPRFTIDSVDKASDLNVARYGANARAVNTCQAVGPRCVFILGNKSPVNVSTKAYVTGGTTKRQHALAA